MAGYRKLQIAGFPVNLINRNQDNSLDFHQNIAIGFWATKITSFLSLEKKH
jgi:hypothetical protein